MPDNIDDLLDEDIDLENATEEEIKEANDKKQMAMAMKLGKALMGEKEDDDEDNDKEDEVNEEEDPIISQAEAILANVGQNFYNLDEEDDVLDEGKKTKKEDEDEMDDENDDDEELDEGKKTKKEDEDEMDDDDEELDEAKIDKKQMAMAMKLGKELMGEADHEDDEDEMDEAFKASFGDPSEVPGPVDKKNDLRGKGAKDKKFKDVEDDDDNFDKKPKLKQTKQVSELFVGHEFSDEFKEEVQELFEEAAEERAQELLKIESDQYIEEAKQELTNRVDSYLDMVVEKWLEDNELAVTESLKATYTNSFIKGLHQLFQEHYIDVPEDKLDIVEDLTETVRSLKSELDAHIVENMDLKDTINNAKKEQIFNEIMEDATDYDKENLSVLIEDVAYKNADQYKESIENIKAKYIDEEVESIIMDDEDGDIIDLHTEEDTKDEKKEEISEHAEIDAISEYLASTTPKVDFDKE